MDIYVLPAMDQHSRSLGLGVLGMPGNTAYFGFLEICHPKAGETVVVTGAGGAVGSIVGQIAKIKGCRVIGFAGTDAKCKWLEEELGFDVAINYKQPNIYKLLKEAAPKGVDCYFDNVGGELSSTIISQMNLFGRISVCGAISAYNADPKAYPQVPILQPTFVFNQLLMEGFIVHRWADRWMEGIKQNYQWIKEGKIKYHETVSEGFENMPQTFIDMLNGKNTGKAIVKV
jgi:prostaglandin reductase 1